MSSAQTSTKEAVSKGRGKLSPNARRGVWAGVLLFVLLGIVLGTKVVPNDDPLAQGEVVFDKATFGAENFPTVQTGVLERAVDAVTLQSAISADASAAATEYATANSGGPVYSVTVTGVFGDAQSGIFDLDVAEFGDEPRIRVQMGPAINGTELRDATGEIQFGQFKNQIDYQDAAAALNDELKAQILADIDQATLTGRTATVTGAFTLINPASWLITPVQVDLQ